MHSLTKLFCLSSLFSLAQHVRAQTTTALYVPTIGNSGGLGGSFLIGRLESSGGGEAQYQLVLKSGDEDEEDSDVTLTLVEGSTTALLSGSLIDDGTTMSLNVACSINGDLSNCAETDYIISGTLTSSSLNSFTETVSPIPVTLVGIVPPPTPGPTQTTIPLPTSLSGSPPSSPGVPPPTPSPQTLPGSLTPTTTPSGTIGSTNSSTGVLNPPNSADCRSFIMPPMFALSLVVLSIVLQ